MIVWCRTKHLVNGCTTDKMTHMLPRVEHSSSGRPMQMLRMAVMLAVVPDAC
jgi:hypothetical protein